MKAKIYLEGGGNSKSGKIKCQEGFRKLLEKCELKGQKPALIACGPRDEAYKNFINSHAKAVTSDYVALLLVDSEDPIADINATWNHLQRRDGWPRPPGDDDEQVLLMTTCMETWIAADRDALRGRYGHLLYDSALPPLEGMEKRDRHDVQNRLERATRNCPQPYAKGPHSFAILGRLNPNALAPLLPSFQRARRILDARL